MKTPSYNGQIDPLLGHVFAGTYRVIGLLGRGGSGSVYEATHLRLPKHVAVKVLRQSGLATADGVERFRREAEILSSLGNRHITEVYDFNAMADGTPYMVMELLQGEDLASRIRRMGRLPTTEALEVAGQVVSALAAAHRQQVVHRDIKPENIFLCDSSDEPFVVKLLDFGLSKIRTAGMMTLTQSESFLGTPAYVSPEQASGETKRVDHRSDVYSLGAVLYEALTGKLPFEAPSVYALLLKVMKEMPPTIHSLVHELPKELDAVIRKAMAKDPDHRYASVIDMWNALQKAMSGSKISTRSLTGQTAIRASKPGTTGLRRIPKALAETFGAEDAKTDAQQKEPASGHRKEAPKEAKKGAPKEVDDTDPTQVRGPNGPTAALASTEDTSPDRVPTLRRTLRDQGEQPDQKAEVVPTTSQAKSRDSLVIAREPMSWPKHVADHRRPVSWHFRWIVVALAFMAVLASMGLLLFRKNRTANALTAPPGADLVHSMTKHLSPGSNAPSNFAAPSQGAAPMVATPPPGEPPPAAILPTRDPAR